MEAATKMGALLAACLLAACGGSKGSSGVDAAAGSGGGVADGGVGGAAGAGQTDAAAAGEGGIVDALPDLTFSAAFPDGRCIQGAFARDGACMCLLPQAPNPCETKCTDLAADSDNCGACGHACAADATCVGGACGPSPTTVVAKPASCRATMTLLAAGDTLYWSDRNEGAVMRIPVAGGTPVKVSDGLTSSPTLLAAKGESVFWLEGPGRIFRSAGGAVSEVTTSPTPIRGLAASDDAATVYFSTGSRILSAPASGGGVPVEVEVNDSGGPAALAVQGNLLASVVDLVGGVNVIDLLGPTPRCWTRDGLGGTSLDVNCPRVARDQGSLNFGVLLAVAPKVVFADGNGIKMAALSAAATAYESREEITAVGAEVVSMATSGGAVFFMTFDAWTKLGTVQRVAVQRDATPVLLARNVHGRGSIAAADGKVFWTTADCEIQTTPTAR